MRHGNKQMQAELASSFRITTILLCDLVNLIIEFGEAPETPNVKFYRCVMTFRLLLIEIRAKYLTNDETSDQKKHDGSKSSDWGEQDIL